MYNSFHFKFKNALLGRYPTMTHFWVYPSVLCLLYFITCASLHFRIEKHWLKRVFNLRSLYRRLNGRYCDRRHAMPLRIPMCITFRDLAVAKYIWWNSVKASHLVGLYICHTVNKPNWNVVGLCVIDGRLHERPALCMSRLVLT